MVPFFRFFGKEAARSRHRSLRVESLESRCLLEASGITLADDLFDLPQNGPQVSFDVLANDRFDDTYDGERLITSVSYGSEGGRVEIGGDEMDEAGQTILYTPPADFFGTEQFVYAVDGRFTAQVSVTIQAPLEFDQYEIPPDGVTRSLDVLANDPFWPGYAGPRQITTVSVGSLGGVVEIGDDARTVQYTPAEGASGEETFVYVVDELYPARVTITVPEPLRDNQYEQVQHAPPLVMRLLANDPFWSGYSGERRITNLTQSRLGATLEISADGQSVTYTQPEDFSQGGWDSFRYVVDGTYEANVSIVLHRPVQDDRFEVDENSSRFFFSVTQNDTYRDLKNRTLDVIDRVTSVTQPESGGRVVISSDGKGILYTPPVGFTGSDTFRYVADDAHEATVRVQVTRPVRDDMIFQGVFQDTPRRVVDVLANDFLGNGYEGPRQITEVGPTENGGVVTIGADGRAILYTPAPGATGEDRFGYTVDGRLQAVATVYVRPLAQQDSLTFCPDPELQTYPIDVLANDYFDRGYLGPGLLTGVELVDGSGQVSIVNGSMLLFTPATAGYHLLRYTVDGEYETTVSVRIPDHLEPDQVVVDQNADAQEVNLLANDFDPDPYYVSCKSQEYLGARRITGVTQSVQGGIVTLDGESRTVQYAPPTDYSGPDTFTYTVDGFMTETVSVEVIRRVRDDWFRVDAQDGPASLPVLANDLFGADYQGTGQLTEVTTPSAGGLATIAEDGQSIVYTPAAGFVGTDTFTYTVDESLQAQVSIVVDLPRDDAQRIFGSFEAYLQFLIDDAQVRYGYLFGTTAWTGGPFFFGETMFNASDTSQRSSSETNVQVAGVDEGDIVEFDSDYLYMLTDREAIIIDAGFAENSGPVEDLEVTSRIAIEGRPVVEYLLGDRLTVISEIGGWINPTWQNNNLFRGDLFWPPISQQLPFETIVTVIDVSDRADPQIVQTTSMEGRYVDSRGVGDYVYLLVTGENVVGGTPEIIDDDDDPETPGRYETEEQYLARVTANPGQFVEEALPGYTTYGPDGEMVRTGLLNMPGEIYQPIVAGAKNLISVVSLNVESDEPGLADTSAVYGTGASTIYASLENFYVFDRDYSVEDGAVTRIVKFDWDPATGGVEFAATTTVAGTILNQFSADEYDGNLRIATTVSNRASGNWSGRDENMLYVLQEDAGIFEIVGSLQNLALDETIQSVRFLGERAFVTTFRTIDPLFAIDLSDPAVPRAVGHVTLPGFTSYMQLIDQNYLLTVGRNTPSGTSGPTQVALFDISDLTGPRRIAEYTFPRFSTSEAELEHLAFGYYAEHGLLAIPMARQYVERVDEDGDGYRETVRWVREDELAIFSVDTEADDEADRLELVGQIEHDTPVRRSGYIGDLLFSIAGNSVKVVAVSDPNRVIDELVLGTQEEPGEVTLISDIPTLPLGTRREVAAAPLTNNRAVPGETAVGEVAQRVRATLARNLGQQAGAPMLVTAETVPQSYGGGYTFVFQVGDDFTRVRSSDNGWVLQIDAGYEFQEISGAWHAVEWVVATPPENRPSDYDQDMDVDGNDFLTWQRSLGSNATGPSADDHHSGAGDLAVWESDFGESQVDLSLIQGDYDRDLDVDGADFLAWQRSLGAAVSGQADLGRADGDRSGSVDAGDLAVWDSGFGRSMTFSLLAPDDYDQDSDIDGNDFLWWQRSFRSTVTPSVDADRDTDRDRHRLAPLQDPRLVDAAIVLVTRDVAIRRNGHRLQHARAIVDTQEAARHHKLFHAFAESEVDIHRRKPLHRSREESVEETSEWSENHLKSSIADQLADKALAVF